MAWFCERRTAAATGRLSRTQMRRSAATDSNRQRRFGKPSARSGTPFGRPLRNRIQAIINNPRPVASCVGAVPTGGPPRTIGYTPIRSMWHGFATCGLRPATGAPYKGRPRPTNLSGLLGHLPYKGRHNDERIAEGDKPRTTNH